MDEERSPATSHRLLSLAEKFHDKQYRDSYVAAHNRRVLAEQMRNFRGDHSQAEYAAKIGKQKTVVGRLENPAYGGWSLRTMLEVAHKENVAVFVRFVDFPTFLKLSDDLTDQALHPTEYDAGAVEQFVAHETLMRAFSPTTWSPGNLTAPLPNWMTTGATGWHPTLDEQTPTAGAAWTIITATLSDNNRITVSTKDGQSMGSSAANANTYTVYRSLG